MSGFELSSISSAAIPADVKAAGAEAQEQYKAALGFEHSLLQQLTKTMFKSAEGAEGGEDSEGESAATSAY